MFEFFKKIISGGPERIENEGRAHQSGASHDVRAPKKSDDAAPRPWGEKKDQKKPEWWTEVVSTDPVTHFPRTEDLALPTSREALRGSLLALLGIQEHGHLQSQHEFVTVIDRWAGGATDADISRLERLAHRVNAMHGIHGGEAIQRIVMPVIEDTLFHIKRAEYARPSFRFRGRVLEFLKTGDVLDGPTEPSVAGRDSYHKTLAQWLEKSDETGIRKLELFLLKAREVMKKNGNGATVEDVIEDSLKLINEYRIRAGIQQPVHADRHPRIEEQADAPLQESAEQTEHILARYRGTILTGIGLLPAGTPVEREPFDAQLHAWLRAGTTSNENIDRLTKFVQKITAAASSQKIGHGIRDFIDHVNTMLIEGVRDRIARPSRGLEAPSPSRLAFPPVPTAESLRPQTEISSPQSSTPPQQEISHPLTENPPQQAGEPAPEHPTIMFTALNEHDICTDEPSVFRAKMLESIGASDGQEAVGQKYFENRLREWLVTISKNPDNGALRLAAADFIKQTKETIASSRKVRKKSEKNNTLKTATTILNPESLRAA